MAEEFVTPLATAFPTNAPNTSGASSGTATETPLGATPARPLGIETPDIAAREKANRGLAGVVAEEGENALNRAVMGQEQAGATADVTADNLAEMHQFHDKYQKTLDAEMKRGDELAGRIEKSAKFHDYWADKSVGDKLLATIASGLLGFGTGQGHNVAKDLADADHGKQVQQLNALMKMAEMQGAHRGELMKIHEDATAHLTMVQGLKYKKIADEYAKQAALATTVEQRTAAKKAEEMFLKLAGEEKLKYDMSRRVKSSKSATQAVKPAAAARQD